MSITKTTILIVDDNQENIKLLANSISIPNVEIAAALNGQDALYYIQQELPDLILLDIMMPEPDGFELCKILKADYRTTHIPIIFLSALNDADSIVKGLEIGASDYLTKPFHVAEINARIKMHLKITKAHEYAIELLRDFVKSIPDMNLIIDENGIIVQVFSTHEMILGNATIDEIIDTNIAIFLPSPIGNHITKRISQVLATGKSIIFDQELILDNITYVFAFTLSPMKHQLNGKAMLSLNILDITSHKSQENQVNMLYEYNRHNLFFNTLLSGEYTSFEQNNLLATIDINTHKRYGCYAFSYDDMDTITDAKIMNWLKQNNYTWVWQWQNSIVILEELPSGEEITASAQHFQILLQKAFINKTFSLGAVESNNDNFDLKLLNAWANIALLNAKSAPESNIFIANTANLLAH